MTAACDTFFSIPELLEHLAQFLRQQDHIIILQVNHTINSILTPPFWRSLNLTDQELSKRLLASPEGLKAFGNNVSYIRYLDWKSEFTQYYIHALWTYLNTAPSPTHKQISTDALSHPRWGALTVPDQPLVFQPLPPLLHLTHYTGLFRVRQAAFSQPEFPQELNNLDRNSHEYRQHHVLWLLRLNRETLVFLQLEKLLTSPCVTRDFCRTISQFDHLRVLRLIKPHSREKFDFRVLKWIFFSCPASLVEFTMMGHIFPSYEFQKTPLDPEENDWDYDQGPLVRRQEPLYHLKVLKLPFIDILRAGYPSDLLCPIFEHCPALEMLTLPSLRATQAVHDVSVTINSYCLRIKDLTFFSSRWGNDAAFMNIMRQMQRQQLENLRIFLFSDSSSETLSAAAFMRHSETLCRIEFPNCRSIKSLTLHAILASCRALEILNVSGFSTIHTALTLEDAVGAEWVCTKIRHLEIAVSLTLDGRDPAYFADPTTVTWTQQDHRHWGMMNKFYTQVGFLTDLQILSLQATQLETTFQGEFEEPFRTFCLPGLLALEDATTGQIGFLSRWSELSHLQELGGSFLWTNTEAVARMGEQEVEWFATHLPALRRAAFVNVKCENGRLADNLPRTLHELHRRRPEIQLDFNMEGPAMFR